MREGKTSPIVECGLSNLSPDTVPALLHFSDGQPQQWLMVRLEEPKEYRTPNIDRIAKEGVIFTDHYAQHSCTAGRAAFITIEDTGPLT